MVSEVLTTARDKKIEDHCTKETGEHHVVYDLHGTPQNWQFFPIYKYTYMNTKNQITKNGALGKRFDAYQQRQFVN